MQGSGIAADPTVPEGGVISVRVSSGSKTVTLLIPRVGPVDVPVRDGVAEYRLPPGVRGGTIILISDHAFPNPSSTSVEVVGNQRP